MSKNILDAEVRKDTLSRVDALTPEHQRRWGRLSVNEMVCHLGDQIRLALGDLEAKDISSVFTRSGLKWMVLAGMPFPKGKVQTFEELDHAKGGGTQAVTLADDIETLKNLVARFVDRSGQDGQFTRNPVFGALSNKQWGRLVFLHMNHHLAQFGA